MRFGGLQPKAGETSLLDISSGGDKNIRTMLDQAKGPSRPAFVSYSGPPDASGSKQDNLVYLGFPCKAFENRLSLKHKGCIPRGL